MQKYFWWLVFIGALFAVPNLLAIPNIVRLYYIPWLDALVTCALLAGPAIIAGSLLGAVLFSRVERAGIPGVSLKWRSLPRAVVVALFLVAWLRLLRGMLIVYKIEYLPLGIPFELLGAVAVALPLAGRFPAWLASWVDQTAARVRPVSVLVVASVLGLLAYFLVEPSRRGGAGPVTLQESSDAPPNVIVIVLDAMAARDMSLYGYRLPTTPNLERLSESWTVFDNAHATASATIAVQPAILTGRYPYWSEWYRYGELARAEAGLLNLPQILKSAGYRTIYGMGGGWPPSRYHLHTGFDRIIGRGAPAVSHPENPTHHLPAHEFMNRALWSPTVAQAFLFRGLGKIDPRTTDVPEPMYATASELINEQASRQSSAPLFLYLHLHRPHHPFLAEEFLGRFLPIEEGLADVGSQARYIFRDYTTGEQPMIDRLRLRYGENILKADQQVGDLIAELQRLGLYDQSLIVVTSDHGVNFTGGYQGYFSSRLAAAEHHVPLMVKYPGQTKGERVRAAVSVVDILPTALDVVGVSYPPEWVDGHPLQRAGQDPDRIVFVSRVRFEATVERDTIAAVRGNLKLLQRQGEQFLYNLADDPNERWNLLGQVPSDDLQAALDQFVRRGDFARAGGEMAEAPVLLQTVRSR